MSIESCRSLASRAVSLRTTLLASKLAAASALSFPAKAEGLLGILDSRLSPSETDKFLAVRFVFDTILRDPEFRPLQYVCELW